MQVFRILNKFISFVYFIFAFRRLKLAYYFSHYRLSYKGAKGMQCANGMLSAIATGNKIPVKSMHLFKLELEKVMVILKDANIKVVSYDNNGFTVHVNGITLQVLSLSNIVTLFEIFVDRIYDVYLPQKDNVLVDIGMNVGYASLFFAAEKHMSHIYSFEPFPGTYHEALSNLALNKMMNSSITPVNEGVSNYTGDIDVPMMESGSGGASTSSMILQNNTALADKQLIKVRIRNIAEVMPEILHKHPRSSIYLKIDCEGEEYVIIEALKRLDMMSRISGFIIEWHQQGYTPIIDALQLHNFSVLNLSGNSVVSGMIYAFKPVSA